MAPSASGVEDPLKCCGKNNSYVSCIQCNTVYHKSCADRSIETGKFAKVGKNKVVCCESACSCQHNLKIKELSNEISSLKTIIATLVDKFDKWGAGIESRSQELLNESNQNQSCGDARKPRKSQSRPSFARAVCESAGKPSDTNLIEAQKNLMTDIINLNRDSVKINTKKERSRNANEMVTPREDPFALAKNKKRKKSGQAKFSGSAAVSSGDTSQEFLGRDIHNKKIWLFITKIRDHVTEEIVEKYIANKTGKTSDTIEVKLLQTKNDKPNNKSFIVGVSLDLKEDIYKEKFWPVGVTYSRFNFARGKHLLNKKENFQEAASTLKVN